MNVTLAEQFDDGLDTESELLAHALDFCGAKILPGESAITAAARVLMASGPRHL